MIGWGIKTFLTAAFMSFRLKEAVNGFKVARKETLIEK